MKQSVHAGLKRRRVIVSIDDIVSMMRDYCPAEDFPSDVAPLRLMLKPNERGKLAIEAESRFWQHGLPPLQVRFELRRLHSL